MVYYINTSLYSYNSYNMLQLLYIDLYVFIVSTGFVGFCPSSCDWHVSLWSFSILAKLNSKLLCDTLQRLSAESSSNIMHTLDESLSHSDEIITLHDCI